MKNLYIDQEVLHSLYGDCQESKSAVFTEFLNSYTTMKKEIGNSQKTGDLELLKKTLHSNGPSFMYVGLPIISEMFKNLEHSCVEGCNQDEIKIRVQSILDIIDEAEEKIVKEMKTFTSIA